MFPRVKVVVACVVLLGASLPAPVHADGYLGVKVQPIMFPNGQGGVQVASVNRSSPAEAAGIMPGDIILTVGDRPVASVEELIRTSRNQQPGARVTLQIVRNGRVGACVVTVGDLAQGLQVRLAELKVAEVTCQQRLALLQQHKAELARGNTLLDVTFLSQTVGDIAVEEARLNNIRQEIRDTEAQLRMLGH
jgi:predicted metalloprotease with PDZ domain